MRKWIWRQIGMELPDDWELLQFTKDPKSGRCSFADRRHWRLELDWREVAGPPDFGRMIADYRAKLEEDGVTNTQAFERPPWYGVTGSRGELQTARYGRYFPEGKCLAELVFLWPRHRDTGLERTITGTVAYVPPAGGLTDWRAFGLSLRTVSALDFRHCSVQPACAEMLFRTRGHRRTQCFARRGMVENWLTTPLADWLRLWIPRGLVVQQETTLDTHGHRIIRVRGTRRFPTLKEFVWGRRDMEAVAWICPEDGRLYSMYDVGSHRLRGRTDPNASLSCCSSLEVSI